MVLLCCEATAVLPDSLAVSGGGSVGGGRGVGAPASGTTEGVDMVAWCAGRRERKGMKKACILVTFHIL